jgi:hypothetical protein
VFIHSFRIRPKLSLPTVSQKYCEDDILPLSMLVPLLTELLEKSQNREKTLDIVLLTLFMLHIDDTLTCFTALSE